MRSLLVLLAMTTVAHADRGYFMTEAMGGAAFRGGLNAYGSGMLELGYGLAYRHDKRVYGFDVFGGWSEGDIDGSGLGGSFVTVGLDVKQLWDVVDSRWSRFGVQFGLHGGPRYYSGSDALNGYGGPGLRAGATIEANLWVYGMTLDFGFDAMALEMPVDTVTGYAPYVLIGGKAGWL